MERMQVTERAISKQKISKVMRSADSVSRCAGGPPCSQISQLHAVLGNHSLGKLLQAKLAVSQSRDLPEQEAERAASERLSSILPSWHAELGEKLEELGRTTCDLDQAK